MAREELYSIVDGERRNAHLHEPILDIPEAERAVARATSARLTALGFTPAQIERLFGPSSSDDGSGGPV